MNIGIGGISDSVFSKLKNHKNIGVHSTLLTDVILDLMKSGAVDNSRKVVKQGFVTAGCAMGSKKLYKEINDNPYYYFDSVEFTNNPNIIAMNPKFIT